MIPACVVRWIAVFSVVGCAAGPAVAVTPVETPSLSAAVNAGELPPAGQRLPAEPLVVDLSGEDVTLGRHGGEIDMIMGRAKDIRQLVVYGYARLVGYDRELDLVPDLLRDLEVSQGRQFTLHLRRGHRWSDGHPFTAEDFRYWWEDMVLDREFTGSGAPTEMLVEGELPTFEVIDEVTVRYTWQKPNPFFLPALASATPLFIFKPAHYMKQFHAKYADAAELEALVDRFNQRNWVALHFYHDQSYKFGNPDMPTLQPWRNTTEPPAERFVFERNPFYHRVDREGRQLPYIDRINVVIANSQLIPAKVGAGEAHLQSRGLSFNNYTFLKQGEKRGNFSVHLWPTAKGSQFALFPNLNADDPQWRTILRKPGFRRALSLAINRFEINQVIYFGLALEGNNTVLPDSPLHRKAYTRRWAQFDLDRANKLLNELGLFRRDDRGVRLLPDGRPMDIIVEVADNPPEAADILELIHDSWLEIGIKLYTKPLQREVFRNRVFSGATIMAVWTGLENGVPTLHSSPQELAPVDQNQLQWPKWGQYYQTKGAAGEPIDMAIPQRLFELNQEWRYAEDDATKRNIWHTMLDLHAANLYSIGVVAGVLQPVVVSNRLHNVPEKAIFNWDPGAQFGMYRPDQFWLDPQDPQG